MQYKRGDIYYVELPISSGSVQTGIRPCLNIQNDKGNAKSPTILVLVVTKKLHKNHLPTHVSINKNNKNGLRYNSCVEAEQIFTVSKEHQVMEKIGYLDLEDIKKVNKALAISIGL